MFLSRGAYASHKRLCVGEDGLNRGIRINTRIKLNVHISLRWIVENCFSLCRCQVPVCNKISVRPNSDIRLAGVISYYFTQMVNVMGIETEDLSYIWSEYCCTEILAHHVQYMSFLLALTFYNASLQINIVHQCKDWSIFCFDLADDLVPCN